MTPQELLSKHGIELPDYSPGRHYTTCSQCSRDRSCAHQNIKVLGVTIEADGSVRWGCNHCGWSGPQKGNGGGHQSERTSYIYRDLNGAPVFRKVRNTPGNEPPFYIQKSDGNGGWLRGAKGVDTKIIYRADEVAKAIAEGRTIACVEGEKDADNLWRIGIAATTSAHGASEPTKNQKPKWLLEHSRQLKGADIVVFNDNDPPGYLHADTCCRLSLGIARRVRRLDLARHWEAIPKGGDVSDWLEKGDGTEARLRELIAQAPEYTKKEPEQDPPAITLRKLFEQTADADVLNVLIRSDAQAELNEAELERLIRYLKQRTGDGILTIKRMVRQARERRAAAARQAQRDRLRVERNDQRPQLACPAQDAPWLPVMGTTLGVVAAAAASRRVKRDIDEAATRPRRLVIPRTHAFSKEDE